MRRKLGRERQVVEGEDPLSPPHLGKAERPDGGDHPSRPFLAGEGRVRLKDQGPYPLAEHPPSCSTRSASPPSMSTTRLMWANPLPCNSCAKVLVPTGTCPFPCPAHLPNTPR